MSSKIDDRMKIEKTELKRLKEWLEERKKDNQTKNFNHSSHYERSLIL